MAALLHLGEKGRTRGDELQHAQWIICNPKNKIIAHHIVNNIKESHIDVYTSMRSIL